MSFFFLSINKNRNSKTNSKCCLFLLYFRSSPVILHLYLNHLILVSLGDILYLSSEWCIREEYTEWQLNLLGLKMNAVRVGHERIQISVRESVYDNPLFRQSNPLTEHCAKFCKLMKLLLIKKKKTTKFYSLVSYQIFFQSQSSLRLACNKMRKGRLDCASFSITYNLRVLNIILKMSTFTRWTNTDEKHINTIGKKSTCNIF